ncbi:urokinase plasminogen activator surface receptor-like isoform X2 [Engystomops pustulosus]|uniref:urokinase plasminogen activator surface receptor-like isoform X2 n=1 Tax=Engystomops pustulosus TaxID=76066 RepID=UPI003AFA5E9F
MLGESRGDLALRCLQCSGINSDTCVGVSVDCPNSTECYEKYEYYHAWSEIFHSIEKGCNPGLPCNTVNYISNFDEKDIFLYTQCCARDDCNTGIFQMPPVQKEHNGRICTSCFGNCSAECISDRKVQCLNEEDKCVDVIAILRDPGGNFKQRNFKGCASPLACEYKFAALIGVEPVQVERAECSDC